MMRPVTIKGKRVALGLLIEEDLERLWKWVNDKEVTQFLAMFPRVISKEEEQKWLQRVLQGDSNIIFAILLLPNLEHIGNLGLHKIDLIDRNAELGIFIGEKKYWGQGLGEEAIILALDYAFNVLNLKKVYLKVYEFNKRAIRCYEKVGFKLVGRLRQHLFRGGRWWDVLIMDILDEEFRRKHRSIIAQMCKDVFKS